MNTVDALTDLAAASTSTSTSPSKKPSSLRPANFLDTGGKATSSTVKSSFRTVLSDPRVTVIFVNIFGGLTLCDMIARGILLAYRELDLSSVGRESMPPVVVRLRGTNELEGQDLIREESGKGGFGDGEGLFAFDDFEEAALKAIELASRQQKQ